MIALVIPCYNEENRIDTSEYKRFLRDNNNIFMLFIDDGSTDNTVQRLEEITELENSKYIILNKNSGKAEAVRLGVIELLKYDYDYIGFWDADLATPLIEVKYFSDIFMKNKSILGIIGSRMVKPDSNIQYKISRRYIGRLLTSILYLGPLKNISVYDTQCGAKIFTKEICDLIFQSPFKTDWLFDVEILMRINNVFSLNRIIYECPLKEWTHIPGSKINFHDYYSIFKELVKLFRLKF
jgi:dolichyl-phosphate beta-glucosyltransferase